MDSNPEKHKDIYLADTLQDMKVTLDILHAFRENTVRASMSEIIDLAYHLQTRLSAEKSADAEPSDEMLFELKTHVESLVLEKTYILKKQAEMLGELMFSLDKIS